MKIFNNAFFLFVFGVFIGIAIGWLETQWLQFSELLEGLEECKWD